MRGFVLSTALVRDEDLVVRILTKNEVLTLYRFYGARHSYINEGFLIDFVVEESAKATINRLRNVVQIPFEFMFDMNKMLVFKSFVRLLNKHLIDVSKIDSFYFDLLLEISEKLKNRDAKRLIVESYVKLLEKEGRLHKDKVCFLCEKKVEKKIALARAFLPAHEKCIMSDGFDEDKIDLLFKEKKSLLFSEKEIDRLFRILEMGL